MGINNIVSGNNEVSVIHTQKHGLSKPSGPRTVSLGFQEGVSMEKGRDDPGTDLVRVGDRRWEAKDESSFILHILQMKMLRLSHAECNT